MLGGFATAPGLQFALPGGHEVFAVLEGFIADGIRLGGRERYRSCEQGAQRKRDCTSNLHFGVREVGD